MTKAIVIYETRSGNTEMMAKAIVAGLEEAGVDVELKRAVRAKADDLRLADVCSQFDSSDEDVSF